MREVVIASAARTPVGNFQGSLADVPATRLGSIAIEAAIERAGISVDDVDQCIMGCVLPAGLGQAPARQAAIGAKLPESVDCMTVNKVCGSGLKAVMVAFDVIRLGEADVVVAGGMESMTGAPYALPKARSGYRMGDGQIKDLMINDGLWDVYNNFHMGVAAELCAEKFGFTREIQDEFALESYARAQRAQKEGLFKDEIVPVSVPQRKGDPIVVSDDEGPARARPEKVPTLRPAFKKDGTVTAANASSINDGAAACVVTSAEFAKERGLQPLARIIAYSSASLKPEWFTIAPAEAMKKLFEKTNMTPEDIDLYEINEAFSCVTLKANKDFSLDTAKVNVHGGAVALGHPIGASGARILVTLLYAMQKRDAKRGLATLCIGGGEAVAMIVER
jgi:acetyl-CoA C-acetyltransferase